MSPMLFSSPEPTGILPPHTTRRVPLVITPQGLEELETFAEFSIFGSMEPPLVSPLSLFNLIQFKIGLQQ